MTPRGSAQAAESQSFASRDVRRLRDDKGRDAGTTTVGPVTAKTQKGVDVNETVTWVPTGTERR